MLFFFLPMFPMTFPDFKVGHFSFFLIPWIYGVVGCLLLFQSVHHKPTDTKLCLQVYWAAETALQSYRRGAVHFTSDWIHAYWMKQGNLMDGSWNQNSSGSFYSRAIYSVCGLPSSLFTQGFKLSTFTAHYRHQSLMLRKNEKQKGSREQWTGLHTFTVHVNDVTTSTYTEGIIIQAAALDAEQICTWTSTYHYVLLKKKKYSFNT